MLTFCFEVITEAREVTRKCIWMSWYTLKALNWPPPNDNSLYDILQYDNQEEVKRLRKAALVVFNLHTPLYVLMLSLQTKQLGTSGRRGTVPT